MEQDPDAAIPLLVLASCPVDTRPPGAPRLWGGLRIETLPNTVARAVYGAEQIEETFTCNYELNPVYREVLEHAGLVVSGVSQDGGARIIELPDHPFFLGTGFVPQLGSTEKHPHPVILALLRAAAGVI